MVGPVQVVGEEYAGGGALEERQEGLREPFIEALARARPADPRCGWTVGQLWHELRRLGTRVRIDFAFATLGERRADRVGDQPIRERSLTGVRAHRHCNRAQRAGVCNVVLAEPRLADAGFALERNHSSVDRCFGV